MRKCKICGNLLTNKQKVYCSVKCQYEGYKVKTAKRINCICQNCRLTFEVKESNLKYGRGKYCSRKCSDIAKKKTYLGKNNPMFGIKYSEDKKKQISERTTKLWKTPAFRNNVKNGIKKFVKKTGYWPGMSILSIEKRKQTMLKKYGIEHTWNGKYGTRKCDKTVLKKYGKSSVELRQNALFLAKITNIEKIISGILNENNILYVRNFKIIYDIDNVKYKYYDFYLPEYDILIEADGDYWHGNPIFFKKLNKIQQKNIKNDKFKNDLANKSGFKLIRFWENKIYETGFNACLLEELHG